MSYPGASSGRSKVTPFRTESNRQTQKGSGPPGTRDGMGWVKGNRGKGAGRGNSRRDPGDQRLGRIEDTPEWRWVRKHLPDQHPGHAVAAARMVKLARQPINRETVLARLKATGRDADTIGWGPEERNAA